MDLSHETFIKHLHQIVLRFFFVYFAGPNLLAASNQHRP